MVTCHTFFVGLQWNIVIVLNISYQSRSLNKEQFILSDEVSYCPSQQTRHHLSLLLHWEKVIVTCDDFSANFCCMQIIILTKKQKKPDWLLVVWPHAITCRFQVIKTRGCGKPLPCWKLSEDVALLWACLQETRAVYVSSLLDIISACDLSVYV